MLRSKRNEKIDILSLGNEYHSYLQVSGVLGDSELLDIDWDDLSQALNIEDLSSIESILEDMYNDEVLLILDFEDNIYG